MQPEILISEAAHAIQNGCQNVFGPLIVTMFWFHVVLNFHKRKFNHPENEDLMKDDLRQLHLTLKLVADFSKSGNNKNQNLQPTSKHNIWN